MDFRISSWVLWLIRECRADIVFSYWNEVYEAILAPYIFLPTLVALIDPKHGKFNVTAKDSSSTSAHFDWHIAWPYATLLFLNIVGLFSGIYRFTYDIPNRGPLAMNLVWTVFNMIILSAAVAVAQEPQQRRSNVRIETRMPLKVILADGQMISCEIENISNGGAAILPKDPYIAEKGQSVTLRFEVDSEPQDFVASVVSAEPGRLRVHYLPMTLEQESELVRIIYGRADSWIRWRRGHQDDQPLRSLLQLSGYAVRGFVVMIQSLFPRKLTIEKTSEPIQRASLPVIAALCCLLGLTGSIKAQSPPAGKRPNVVNSNVSPQAAFEDTLNLRAFGIKEPIVLRGTTASATVSFTVSVEKLATAAAMQLQFRVSPNMVPHTSRIDIILNNVQVASVPIDPDISEPNAEISVPVELRSDLLGTENTLTFQLTAQCASGCNGGQSQELWARIEPVTSLRISGTRLVLADDLRLLHGFSKPGNVERGFSYSIVFDEPPGREELEAAGIFVSKSGVIADFSGVRVHTSIGQLVPGNVIFFGRSNGPVPVSLGLGSQHAPTIAMRNNPNDMYGKLILVLGDNGAQIRAAATAVALQNSLSGPMSVFDSNSVLPTRVPYDAPRWEVIDRTDNLGQTTSGRRRVVGNGDVKIYFRIPPDLYFGQRGKIPLNVTYQCQNVLKEGGRWTAFLNGEFAGTRPIKLASVRGPVTETIGLPVPAFTENNTLTIAFSFADAEGNSITSDPPEARVMENTSLDLRGISHFVELPRLDLIVNAGFPFTRMADLSETAIVLPRNPSPDEITLYLFMMAVFGARTGYPAVKASVLTPEEAVQIKNKDLLVITVGEHREIPQLWYTHSPWQAVQASSGPQNVGLVQRLRFLPWGDLTKERTKAAQALANGPPPNLIFQEFISPTDPERVINIIQAKDIQAAASMEQTELGYMNPAEVYGDLSFYQNGHFHSFRVLPDVLREGNLSSREFFNYWVSSYFLAIPLLFTSVAIGLAFVSQNRIEKRAKARLEDHL